MSLKFIFINKYLFYGDPLLFDRGKWVEERLPKTKDNWKLLDVGCGSGAITIKTASLGYFSYGITWSESERLKAIKRAKSFGLKNCKFDNFDARKLDKYDENEFDVILNTENIEHIIDDLKLFKDSYSKLKKGGFLLLTTPNFYYKPISESCKGPYRLIEDGGHVRRGYTREMLKELCLLSGFIPQEISSCSGFFSQKVCSLFRVLNRTFGLKISWLMILPLRILPIIFDPLIKKITNYQDASICLVAYKPRFQ